MHFINKWTKRIWRNESGLAYIEFAISISVLLLLFFGGVEVARYMLIIQKQEKTATQITDVTSQFAGVISSEDAGTQATEKAALIAYTSTTLPELMGAARDMMAPYTDPSATSISADKNIFVIVSDVSRAGSAAAKINWSECAGGLTEKTTLVPTASGVNVTDIPTTTGTCADSTTPTASIPLCPNEEAIITEVYFSFAPIIANNNILGNILLYRTSAMTPRNGSLTAAATAKCG